MQGTHPRSSLLVHVVLTSNDAQYVDLDWRVSRNTPIWRKKIRRALAELDSVRLVDSVLGEVARVAEEGRVTVVSRAVVLMFVTFLKSAPSTLRLTDALRHVS